MGREYVSNADELKKQLRAVEGRRADIEAELRSCFDRLPEDPGLNGPLIDREGFPRADVDIPLVREVRQKIIRKLGNRQDVHNTFHEHHMKSNSRLKGLVARSSYSLK